MPRMRSTDASSFRSGTVSESGVRLSRLLKLGVLLALVSACAEIKAPPEASYPTVRLAARSAGHALADQISRASWSGVGSVWVAPAINFHSGEITASGRELQIMLALDLKSAFGEVVVQSLGGENQKNWSWVLSPSVTFERPKDDRSGQSWFRVDISVTNPAGKSLPGITFLVNANNFDATPSKFYKEAPLFLTGKYQQTRLEFAKGAKSSVPLEQRNQFLQIEGRLQDAIQKYETGDYAQALEGFKTVLRDDPENLSALSGRYQSLQEIGSPADTDQALGRLIQAAIKQGNLSLKLLFQVRSAELRDDGAYARNYQNWLKQLASSFLASGRCVQIQGHASRSGSAEYNKELSLARAKSVQAQLLRYSPGLKGRMSAEGRGFQDNIVGSGSDNATDAIDRRVDFRLLPNC